MPTDGSVILWVPSTTTKAPNEVSDAVSTDEPSALTAASAVALSCTATTTSVPSSSSTSTAPSMCTATLRDSTAPPSCPVVTVATDEVRWARTTTPASEEVATTNPCVGETKTTEPDSAVSSPTGGLSTSSASPSTETLSNANRRSPQATVTAPGAAPAATAVLAHAAPVAHDHTTRPSATLMTKTCDCVATAASVVPSAPSINVADAGVQLVPSTSTGRTVSHTSSPVGAYHKRTLRPHDDTVTSRRLRSSICSTTSPTGRTWRQTVDPVRTFKHATTADCVPTKARFPTDTTVDKAPTCCLSQSCSPTWSSYKANDPTPQATSTTAKSSTAARCEADAITYRSYTQACFHCRPPACLGLPTHQVVCVVVTCGGRRDRVACPGV